MGRNRLPLLRRAGLQGEAISGPLASSDFREARARGGRLADLEGAAWVEDKN